MRGEIAAEISPAVVRQEVEVPALTSLPRVRLGAMLMAGTEALEWQQVLERGGINVVSEVLRGQGDFVEYEHYPRDDVYDSESRSQYYYHAHRAGEHGHFHTFLRIGASPEKGGDSPVVDGSDLAGAVHLIGISMNAYGWPIGLFATNRWVCGGAWLPAKGTINVLPRFHLDHAYPSWPVNRWIGAMMVLFQPHIEALLVHRDAVIEAWTKAHPESNAFEDRELEVTGYLPISVGETVRKVRALAGVRGWAQPVRRASVARSQAWTGRRPWRRRLGSFRSQSSSLDACREGERIHPWTPHV